MVDNLKLTKNRGSSADQEAGVGKTDRAASLNADTNKVTRIIEEQGVNPEPLKEAPTESWWARLNRLRKEAKK